MDAVTDPITLFNYPIAPPDGCTTIDRTNTDNGFLDLARQAVPAAGAHSTSQEATGNLVSCIGGMLGSSAHISGHGDAGLIIAGTGQVQTDDSLTYLNTANVSTWRPILAQLRGHITKLQFWSCHTGAEEQGADFLSLVASIVGAPAYGATSLIFCDGSQFYLEDNGVWNVATPNSRAMAIQLPYAQLYRAPTMEFILFNRDTPVNVKSDAISSLDVLPPTVPNAGSTVGARLSHEAAVDLLGLIDFSKPLQFGSPVGAVETARLVLHFSGEEGAEQSREFIVYNDRIIQDVISPHIYYRCTAGFRPARYQTMLTHRMQTL